MALTYHSGERIQGLAYTAPNVTKDENFSNVWTAIGTGSNGTISITDGELLLDTVVGNSDTRVYKALGFTLADDWTARWEQTMKGTTNNNVFMQVMNFTAGNANLNAGTNQDSVHMITDSGAQTIYIRSKDGTTAGNQQGSQALTTDTKYYMEFVKDGTGLTLKIRTGSHSGTLVNTITTTCSSGITGLTHIQTGGATGTNSGAASYSFDNIEIWNDATSASGTATYTENFSSASVWTSANPNYSSVNASTNKLDFDFDNADGNADKQMRYDLTSVATNWILRFKLNWSVLGNSANAYMYIGLSDSVGGAGVSQSAFAMRFINAPTAGSQYVDYGVNQVNSARVDYQGGNGVANMVYTTGKDFYIELQKNGTTLTGTIYENSDFTGMWQTATQTITTTITPTLRYLHFWNSMSANTGTWTGTIDDVEFYNDITTAIPTAIGDEKPTNVELGSRFEETDTRKIYYRMDSDYETTKWYELGTLPYAGGRGVFAGGYSGSNINTIDYITIATTGNATDYGDLSVNRRMGGCSANMTRVVYAGGYSSTYDDTIDYMTIRTGGTATDFGATMPDTKTGGVIGAGNDTRGLFAGGEG